MTIFKGGVADRAANPPEGAFPTTGNAHIIMGEHRQQLGAI